MQRCLCAVGTADRNEARKCPNQKNATRRENKLRDIAPLLRNTFDLLLEDYEVSATIHAGEGSVNYNIIADLVRAGWRHVLP
jgi:hypothetical protein